MHDLHMKHEGGGPPNDAAQDRRATYISEERPMRPLLQAKNPCASNACSSCFQAIVCVAAQGSEQVRSAHGAIRCAKIPHKIGI